MPLKGWTRAKKVKLIGTVNPKWRDLSRQWGRPAQILRPGEPRPQNNNIVGIGFIIERKGPYNLLHLHSQDGTNRLTRACVMSLTSAIAQLAREPLPLIITGNQKFFSAGADLNEIVALSGPEALEFGKMGQAMTAAVYNFPALVIAAINGYCMGGGVDLALACDLRIASPHAIFGHRGATLGLMTGWGGTQRLSRLVGKARALQIFAAAEKLDAAHALRVGLVDRIVEDPVSEAARRVEDLLARPPSGAQG
jgi:enoyl-CoA hydratase/carnithine racemase